MNTYDEEWWIIFLLHFFWFDNIFLCRWKLWGLYRLGSFAREAGDTCEGFTFDHRCLLVFSFRLVHLYGTQTQSSECVKVERRQPLPEVQGGVPSILADADGGDRRCLAPLWPFPFSFSHICYDSSFWRHFFCSRSPCSKKRHWSSCWYSGMLTSCLAWLWGSTWSHQKGASPSRVGSRGRQRGGLS